jgi:hypothetical protein
MKSIVCVIDIQLILEVVAFIRTIHFPVQLHQIKIKCVCLIMFNAVVSSTSHHAFVAAISSIGKYNSYEKHCLCY